MQDPNNYNINNFEIIDTFIIQINFEDGKTQIIDFGKINHKGWWKELEDPNYFKQVKIDDIKNLEWPHGQDFKPEHLYYWEKFSKFYS